MLKHTDVYSAQIDEFMVRHFVKPGVTGWAQVNGYRGETRTLEQMQEVVSQPDPSDRASVEEKYLLEFRVRDRERKLLKKIEHALRRIESGAYGWCLETGEPIGIPGSWQGRPPRCASMPRNATSCMSAPMVRTARSRKEEWTSHDA